jgi:Flp pilus assembly protein TadB
MKKILNKLKIDYSRWEKLYTKFNKLPIIGSYISNLRSKLYINSLAEESLLRFKALVYFIISSLISIILFTVLINILGHDVFSILVSLFIVVYFFNLVIDFLTGNDLKLMKELPDFIQDIKDSYHSTNMVDEAIYNASKQCSYEMSLHAKKIYEVISKGEVELEEYYKVCPNKYLKIIASFAYLTKEYGDKTVKNMSLFIKNLNYIIEDVKLEILKKEKLSYNIKAFNFITVIPILFINLIQSWFSNYFPITKSFYNSATGYLAKVSILLVSFICYTIIRQMQSDKKHSYELADSHWENTFLKLKPVKKLIKFLTPKEGSKEYINETNLILTSGTSMTLEHLYLRKFISLICSFIFFIFLFLSSYSINYKNILTDPNFGVVNSDSIINLGVQSDDEKAKIDVEIIRSVDSIEDEESARQQVTKELYKLDIDKDDIKAETDRIITKIKALSKQHIKWWQVILSLVLAFIFIDIPTWFLKFKKSLIVNDMLEETFTFDTIVLLLMHHSRCSVDLIIEWFEKFSNVFYNPLKVCSNELSKGSLYALNNLRDSVNYKPFKRIINRLLIAEKIPVSKAFDSLETEREFYKYERKDENEKSITRRVSIAELVGFIPFIYVIIIYLIAPIGITAFKQLNDIMELMKGFSLG